MNTQDRDAFRDLARLHLVAALAALERGDATAAGLEIGDAACALADAALLPDPEERVRFAYSRRLTARGIARSLSITRKPAATRVRTPQKRRTAPVTGTPMGSLH